MKNILKILKNCYPYLKDFNPAQKAALKSGFLEKDKNYVIAMPTASGKTLLGILAALKVINNGGKVIYLVPLISLQNEKLQEFKKLENHAKIKIGRDPRYSDLSVMIYESFDILTRTYPEILSDVDLLVVDEFHMLGDYSRGPILECAITKAKKLNPGIRIIALSATLKNMHEIAKWLDAEVFEHDYRPVPLHKDVLVVENHNVRNKNDLVFKLLKKSRQMLVFVSTRRFTESLANYVAKKLQNREKFEKIAKKILEVPKSKGSPPTPTCKKLAKCVKKGVAFHHAGLFNEQRSIIEEEFKKGNLLMITATPTLMYGVNLPSQVVVIRDYKRWTPTGIQNIPIFDYEQMSGRAGRPQYDKKGYSYLIAKTNEEAEKLYEYYIEGDIEETRSQLLDNKDSLCKQIIGQIASGCRDINDIIEFFSDTFCGYQIKKFSYDALEYEIEDALDFLLDSDLIKMTSAGFKITKLGELASKSNYSVETVVKLKEFVENTTDLNINNLIYELSQTPDLPLISFKNYNYKDRVKEKLLENEIFVWDVGNREATAASLIEWVNEKTEYEIENFFGVYGGSVRRAAYEASKLSKFLKDICEAINIYKYSHDLEKYSARLYYGVKEDILHLVVRVKGLGRRRARKIFNIFGDDIASVSEKELQKVEGIGPKLASAIKKAFR